MENPFRRSNPEIPPATEGLGSKALDDELSALAQQAERSLERLDRHDATISDIDNLEAQRVQGLIDTSEVSGRRVVTDPEAEEPGIRPRESFTAKLTVVPLMGKLARKNAGKIEDAVERADENDSSVEFDIASAGIMTHIRDSLSARRLMRQDKRQKKSEYAEKTYGVNIGLGKKAGIATRVNRVKRWSATRHQYKDGDISAVERRQMINDRSALSRDERNEAVEAYKSGAITTEQYVEIMKKDTEYTTPKAVRKRVRRERTGSAYNSVRAQQPVSEIVRKTRRTVAEKREEREELRLERIDSRIAELEAERRRREEADD